MLWDVLIKMKAYVHKDDLGKEIEECDVPEELKAQAEEYRSKLIEAAAEQDDELMMKYLEEKIGLILLYILFIFIQFAFGYLLGFDISVMLSLFIFCTLLLVSYLIISYRKLIKQVQKIRTLTDNLEEKYLISEIIKAPDFVEGKILKEVMQLKLFQNI